MRLDHDLPGGRAPGLEQHERLALTMRGVRQRLELARIAQRLGDDRDDVGLRIVHEVIDEILDRGAELVAAGDEVAEAELAVGHQRGKRGLPQAPALRDERHTAMAQRLREVAAKGHDVRLDVDEAHAVRPADAHAALRERAQARTARVAGAVAALAKSGREYDRGPNAVRVGLLQHVAGGVGGRRDHDAIDRRRQARDVRIALAAEDLVVARIDGEDVALETPFFQVGDDVRAPPATLRRPDHRDGLGGKQR